MNAYIINATGPSEVFADTATHTVGTGKSWGVIQVISTAVFDTLTGSLTGYAGVSFPAGTLLTGSFTTIDLASGVVIAYLRP